VLLEGKNIFFASKVYRTEDYNGAPHHVSGNSEGVVIPLRGESNLVGVQLLKLTLSATPDQKAGCYQKHFSSSDLPAFISTFNFRRVSLFCLFTYFRQGNCSTS